MMRDIKNRIDLNGIWDLNSPGWDKPIKAHVPGSVLAEMLENGMAQEPYWRTNEYQVRELFREDYSYKRSFTVPEEVLEADELCLVFEGIDTIGDIYLNGELLGKVKDMHRTWRFDIKGQVREKNDLEVYLHAPITYIEEKAEGSDITYSSTGSMLGNGALRKAHYMFGWDWGPQIPDGGIWRSVYVEYAKGAKLGDVHIRQHHKEKSVVVEAVCPVHLFGNGDVQIRVRMSPPEGRGDRHPAAGADGSKVCGCPTPGEAGSKVYECLIPGDADSKVCLEIEEPALWWPKGYGEQPLYKIEVFLEMDGRILESREYKIGLRTITVSTEKDEWGNEFAFVVNGQKIFAMGANYIPEDNILPRLSRERGERLIRDCAAANFNCIRIWGGGYYPEDYLYEACDRYGILVWQDLMFACNVYELDEEFEENILAETRDNVKRIRHHACLALWCGNNEMEWLWDGGGRLKGHHPRYKGDYIKIFEMLLPREVKKYDDQTFYWLSSPSSGGSFDNPNDWNRGDNHYWDVWHANKPFTEYRNFHFRFCSEFGFQSFPHRKTLESFSLEEDRNIFSEVMESHQKNGQANTKIFSYISAYYKYPKDLENIAYISQILQLKAIQYGVEHWRRNWGRCMGSIYWQLNDCWPVASWASIDYYGRWKALHYGAKRFYGRYIASACEEEEFSTKVDYYVLNESFQERDAILEVVLLDRDFHVLYQEERPVHSKAFAMEAIWKVDFGKWMAGEEQKKRVFARYRLLEKGICVSTGVTMFVKPKYFQYQVPAYEMKVEEREDCFAISVKADTFANYVELYLEEEDCVFSDNFFDITDAEGVTVTVPKGELPDSVRAEDVAAGLRVKSVAESY